MTITRWIEFTVSLTVKRNEGSFGIKHDRHGEFRFCALSRADAISAVGSNVKGPGERLIQVIGAIQVERDRSNECLYGDHDFCNFLWCKCPHHSAVQFKLEHPQIPLHRRTVEEEDREVA